MDVKIDYVPQLISSRPFHVSIFSTSLQGVS